MDYKTDEPDEVLDLVDDQDRVIGTVVREEVETKLLELPGNVRAADCFMVNSQGKIWVPRRVSTKRVAPNGLDFSAGEHVKSGETYVQGMVRGFQEELNMTVTPEQLEQVGVVNLRYTASKIPYIEAIFVYHGDKIPDYNKDDFVSNEWIAPEELRRRLQAGEPAKRNLIVALEYYIQAKKG